MDGSSAASVLELAWESMENAGSALPIISHQGRIARYIGISGLDYGTRGPTTL